MSHLADYLALKRGLKVSPLNTLFAEKLAMRRQFDTANQELKDALLETIKEVETKITDYFSSTEFREMIVEQTLSKIYQPQDGKDADENRIIETVLAQMPKPQDGKTPVAGVDFPLPQDGTNYILTKSDKEEIALKVKVPVVKKVVEKVEVIREQPIVTQEIKEVAKTDKPEILAEKLNTLEEKIEQKAIKGLVEELKVLNQNIRQAKQVKGGGMGNIIFKTFSVGSSTTTLTLDASPASGGNALILIYQGQMLENGTHFTISGTIITLTITPVDSTTMFAWMIRS